LLGIYVCSDCAFANRRLELLELASIDALLNIGVDYIAAADASQSVD